jgi:hypothetical protein
MLDHVEAIILGGSISTCLADERSDYGANHFIL